MLLSGIPAGIFSDLVIHFNEIFDAHLEGPPSRDDTAAGGETGGEIEKTSSGADLTSRDVGIAEGTDASRLAKSNRRNSQYYVPSGADALLGPSGRALIGEQEFFCGPELWTDRLIMVL